MVVNIAGGGRLLFRLNALLLLVVISLSNYDALFVASLTGSAKPQSSMFALIPAQVIDLDFDL
jgi:hypothetical protein